MLKLEKAQFKREFSIILNEKASFLTRPLLIAFAVAAAIHLGFLLLIHIAPISYTWSNKTYPPIAVKANLDIPIPKASVFLTDESLLSSGLPPAPPSNPSLNLDHYYLNSEKLFNSHTESNSEAHFEQIELALLGSTFFSYKPIHRPPFQIKLSGPAAEAYALPDIPLDIIKDLLLLLKNSYEIKVLFEIKIASTSGKIFWYDRKDSSGHASIDRKLEYLIKKMELVEIAPLNYREDGLIEIQLYSSEESDD